MVGEAVGVVAEVTVGFARELSLIVDVFRSKAIFACKISLLGNRSDTSVLFEYGLKPA